MISNTLQSLKTRNQPITVITTNDMNEVIEQLFPTEIENAEINEAVVLDYKTGQNKKGDQFVAVFSSPALL